MNRVTVVVIQLMDTESEGRSKIQLKCKFRVSKQTLSYSDDKKK